ncbi:hypothetical protein AMTR_s00074p00034110 [Amborella trichopoda]|uniref:RING-type domain-containing protein n=1 Tax=Amborella trichopoda TaxID=13333 RepID=W1NLZ2_AMBTC|nr:hypothetical protein AMTR_s00074p00034110 [Amborella trichopoda]
MTANKNKGFKEESGASPPSTPSTPPIEEQTRPLQNSDTRATKISFEDEIEEGSNFSESPINSPKAPDTAPSSEIGPTEERPGSSGSGSGSFFGSISEDEDGSLDDWEAVADALQISPRIFPEISGKPVETNTTKPSLYPNGGAPVGSLKPDYKPKPSHFENRTARAWRPDDASRPISLPTLSKQRSFPMNLDRHCLHGSMNWASSHSTPSSCPICYEELDVTDTSFFPCACGFRLCLFCHKRILEADGRCPGCRKHYAPPASPATAPLRLPRSCSMRTRA